MSFWGSKFTWEKVKSLSAQYGRDCWCAFFWQKLSPSFREDCPLIKGIDERKKILSCRVNWLRTMPFFQRKDKILKNLKYKYQYKPPCRFKGLYRFTLPIALNMAFSLVQSFPYCSMHVLEGRNSVYFYTSHACASGQEQRSFHSPIISTFPLSMSCCCTS